MLTRADSTVLAASVVFIACLYAVFWQPHATASHINIINGNEPPQQVSLEQDQVLDVKGRLGNSRIQIQQRRARFIASPCNNKLCIYQGWLQHGGELAACLPNRILITVKSNRRGFDAINY